MKIVTKKNAEMLQLYGGIVGLIGGIGLTVSKKHEGVFTKMFLYGVGAGLVGLFGKGFIKE